MFWLRIGGSERGLAGVSGWYRCVSCMRRGAECGTRLFREEQIPLCVPRPRKCGGKEKARDSVRDDPRLSFAADCKSSGLRNAVALARNQQLRPTKSARRIT